MPTLSPATTQQHGSISLTAADAVWIATAMLHSRHPESVGFSPASIRDEVIQENLTSVGTDTIYQHIIQHLVATKPKNPNRKRMLTELPDGLRRLFLPGDDYHPSKNGAPFKPRPDDLPPHLRGWLLWYEKWSQTTDRSDQASETTDPLLALVGTGTHLYKDEHTDEFLARLRSNWGGAA